MSLFRRFVASFAALSLALSALPVVAQSAPSPAGATGLISTEQLAAADAGSERARLLAALDRAELAAQLQDRGVSAAELRARVAALTDAEAAELMARIDSAPAGADIIGTLFAVFIILLVTDILGFTKVFPFTRSVR